jgi:hypothetical protein
VDKPKGRDGGEPAKGAMRSPQDGLGISSSEAGLAPRFRAVIRCPRGSVTQRTPGLGAGTLGKPCCKPCCRPRPGRTSGCASRFHAERRSVLPAERGDRRQKIIRNDGADMARLYNISAPTVSRIVAAHAPASSKQNFPA